ncbi:putative DNA-binding transcriptional regulator [Thalassovita gelatinovora]|uniref:Putative DNA-binding transcriptional regulator n=1 Tax=Thalassovita gelatinovora TaxID=53501 RepID=A0A0P1FW20_THAGE|nr:MurR/RpiR family transcriptional regulator [Thalassovita gelatinovora]QIZ80246.1 MurR/RpiR family transcriptional regulator [Thalassovita gelatinovora]CUH64117.1 putative DNA-binding transcriptional regulator [Thalassovita gelatinovora]SEQ83666.1 transcriptional regulator, RpiR family [Thalassovita gelatinovora]
MRNDLERRAQAALPDLSPKMQGVLRYLIANSDDIALSSMRTLATACGVTPPTMLRLARKLGYDDWNSLRDELQAELRERVEGPLTTRVRNLATYGQQDQTSRITQDLLEEDERNLRRSWDKIDVDQLDSAVGAMRAARKLFFLGRRSCYPVAYLMYYSYRMIRDNGVMVADHGAGIFNSLDEIGPDDALIVVGYEPYSQESVALTTQAADRGACVLSITDSAVSPLALCADHVFIARNESPAPFQSTIAAHSIGTALMVLITAAEGNEAIETMQRREDSLRQLGAYWEPAPERKK